MPGKPDSPLPPARRAALECLRLVLDQRQDIQSAVDRVLRADSLSAKDSALTTELAYGVVRHKTRLEHMIRFYLRNPEGIAPLVLRTLCLAAYELHFLERVPAYASVDWSVEQVKRTAGQGISRVANAVLRNLDRERDRWVRPPNILEAPFKAWSVFFSLPQWILEILSGQYSREQLLLVCEAQSRPPALGLRFNWSRPEARQLMQSISLEQAPLCTLPTGLAYELAKAPDLNDELNDGLVSRQSITGQEMLWSLGFSEWPEPIYDAAAGRGGKTCFLLEQGKMVWAGDVSFTRLKGLGQELNRLGLPRAPRVLADATGSAPFLRKPRTIFLDAPCSGLGVLSRRPDLKWRLEKRDLSALISVQKEMLENSAAQLPADGLLVYMTCTLNQAENEESIEEICRQADLALESQTLTRLAHPSGEFFFGARLRKRG